MLNEIYDKVKISVKFSLLITKVLNFFDHKEIKLIYKSINKKLIMFETFDGENQLVISVSSNGKIMIKNIKKDGKHIVHRFRIALLDSMFPKNILENFNEKTK